MNSSATRQEKIKKGPALFPATKLSLPKVNAIVALLTKSLLLNVLESTGSFPSSENHPDIRH